MTLSVKALSGYPLVIQLCSEKMFQHACKDKGEEAGEVTEVAGNGNKPLEQKAGFSAAVEHWRTHACTSNECGVNVSTGSVHFSV